LGDSPLIFLAAVFFLLITPGPGVLTTAGVGAAFGASAGYRYVAGLFVGTNLVALAVVTGVAALILAMPGLQPVLLTASVLYLVYLAMRIAFAGSRIAFVQSRSSPGFFNGIALQAINPKLSEILIKFLLINAVWIPIHLLWLSAGIYLQQLNLSRKTQRTVNAAMAISLLLVVALAALAGNPK